MFIIDFVGDVFGWVFNFVGEVFNFLFGWLPFF